MADLAAFLGDNRCDLLPVEVDRFRRQDVVCYDHGVRGQLDIAARELLHHSLADVTDVLSPLAQVFVLQ